MKEEKKTIIHLENTTDRAVKKIIENIQWKLVQIDFPDIQKTNKR